MKYISEFDNVVVDLENFVERFKDIGKNLNLLSTYYLYDILYKYYNSIITYLNTLY